jgi:adenylate kinase family enzyme
MRYRRIHIVGGPGSGKSRVAKRLSATYGIDAYDLDDLFWDRSANNYGTRAAEEDRNLALKNILKNKSWIIEGVYYQWLSQAFKEADLIIILITPVWIRHWRIFKRFIKRKLGLIPSKKESLRDFWMLVKWNHKFDSDNLIRIREFISDHKNKVVECKGFEKTLTVLKAI